MIEYVLKWPVDRIPLLKDVRNEIDRRFGLQLPLHFISTCAKIMENNGTVEIMANGEGYRLIKNNFTIEAFDSQYLVFKTKEKALLNNLIEYVSDYSSQVWEEEEARAKLASYLIKNGVLFGLSTGQYENHELESAEVLIPPEIYVEKYIEYLFSMKGSGSSESYEYLMNVVAGVMVYVGIYYTDPKAKDETFADTNFYFDTKLLLRSLGYSLESMVDAAQELVKEIQHRYRGKICVFKHTVVEVEQALNFAAINMRGKSQVIDLELRTFAEMKKYNEEDFKTSARNVKKNIEASGFKVISSDVRNHPISHKDTLNWNGLGDFIKGIHIHWKPKTIENDSNSIVIINIMRRGDYSIQFGGDRRLPIFVTTNYALIDAVRKYVDQVDPIVADEKLLNARNLPIIADQSLMCRLWLPNAEKNANVPMLTLAASVAAAQQGDTIFQEKFRSKIVELKAKFEDMEIDIVEERLAKIAEHLFTSSNNEDEPSDADEYPDNYDNPDPTVYASSAEEIYALEKIIAMQKNEQLNNEIAKRDQRMKKDRDELIALYTERHLRCFSNRFGCPKVLILFSRYWWVVCAIAIVITTAVVNYLVNERLYSSSVTLALLSVLTLCLLKVFDIFLRGKSATSYIKNKCLRTAERLLRRNIEKRIRSNEQEYANEIADSAVSRFIIK